MSKLIAATKNFVRNEEGATAVEYAMMVALIAAVIVMVVAAIGTKSKDAFTKVDTEMGKAAS